MRSCAISQSNRENDDVRGVDDPDARPGPGSLPSDLRARAPQDVRRAVAAELERMERAEDVRVLLAVESESRAASARARDPPRPGARRAGPRRCPCTMGA